MTEADAQRFALEWIESWNSHDLERILSHYSDDVQVTSPLIETVLGPGRTSVRGKKALRAYWGPALERYPELRFVLFRAYAGPSSLVLHYQSVQGLIGAECMEFDTNGAVCRVLAHYALGADPVAA
jgi:hypothetical protein